MVVTLWLRCGHVVVVWLHCGCMWLCCGCVVVALWLHCGCVWLHCGCIVVTLWLRCGCIVVMLWLHCGYVVVVWLCCGCIVVVLWLCSGCIVVTCGTIRTLKDTSAAGCGVHWEDPLYEDISVPLPGRFGEPSNTKAEIYAAVCAVKQMSPDVSYCLITDSQYLITSVESRLKQWALDSWTTLDGEPITNSLSWQAYYRALAPSLTVSLVKVRSHTGVPGSVAADVLAKEIVMRALPRK